MDRYQRVEKPREETPINENEIRITTLGRMRNYITYATSLLQEKNSNEIVLKAMGRAINKTVMIVELIKRRIVDLHQNTVIGSTDITDTWEPLEEGLLPLETTRHVSVISITLSKTELDISAVGYQPPLPRDQVKPLAEFNYEGEDSPSGRERGRGGRGRGRARGNRPSNYNDGNWDSRGRGFARGAYGRSRGRGYRGRGRGGYGGQPDYQQENSGYAYNDEAPIRSRGRGGYGGQPDYQRENSGYAHNDEAPIPNRGRGGYGGQPDYQQENSGYAYNDEAPIRNRGRARGRGPARGRGGNSRPNGSIRESTGA
ncbi:5'-3' exoribonuclease 2-like isoform X1 [Zingiber officinale]|uniref:5'-3' exoribonuclease 2-like isoform X1 n=1 Tax=Zingiber officinale TaxID=94328 RepID=UPI001C4AFDDC|nr:5'-3' exoribonuclease 2-like isoform X1 [Zingiber officinale]XP_042464204.1 5'-3' exoribonuclease 2-like isoform X1 [Zingiber officinale]